MQETQLYAPIKRFFTELGYAVRGEVHDCDLVAVRDDELIIVEMKQNINLTLVLQGVDRQSMTDHVYLAVFAPRRVNQTRWHETVRLCRRLGLGLITVSRSKKPAVDIVCHPSPYQPRKNLRRTSRLIQEFHARTGDRNVGGSTRTKIMTAYREEALRIAFFLSENGPARVKVIREATQLPGVPSKATSILNKNYYGWFERVAFGVYQLSPRGREALKSYDP